MTLSKTDPLIIGGANVDPDAVRVKTPERRVKTPPPERSVAISPPPERSVTSAPPERSVPSPPSETKEKKKGGWMNKIIDVKEARDQIIFSLPMILTSVAYYFILLISVMFAGHLGQLQLAGSNLANSTAAVTGFSLMVRSRYIHFFD